MFLSHSNSITVCIRTGELRELLVWQMSPDVYLILTMPSSKTGGNWTWPMFWVLERKDIAMAWLLHSCTWIMRIRLKHQLALSSPMTPAEFMSCRKCRTSRKTNNKTVSRNARVSNANYIICQLCAAEKHASPEISCLRHITLRLDPWALL